MQLNDQLFNIYCRIIHFCGYQIFMISISMTLHGQTNLFFNHCTKYSEFICDDILFWGLVNSWNPQKLVSHKI